MDGSASKQCLVGRWSWAGEGVLPLLIASYWARVPLGWLLWATQHAEALYCVMASAVTYMSYIQSINIHYVEKRTPSDLHFSNAPSGPLVPLCVGASESLLEEINWAVNNVEMSSRKPSLFSLRAFCKSVKKTHYWELQRITGEKPL